jgi:acyl-coenzyme A thioesterase PaaI-like protein
MNTSTQDKTNLELQHLGFINSSQLATRSSIGASQAHKIHLHHMNNRGARFECRTRSNHLQNSNFRHGPSASVRDICSVVAHVTNDSLTIATGTCIGYTKTGRADIFSVAARCYVLSEAANGSAL